MLKNQEKTTIGTSLLYRELGSEDNFIELVEITGYPDLGGAPEAIEITTLKDTATVFAPGLDNNETLEFTMVYSVEDFKRLKELEGTQYEFAIWFGYDQNSVERAPLGQYGKFTVNGALFVRMVAAEVNEARTANIHIIPSSEIRFDGGN